MAMAIHGHTTVRQLVGQHPETRRVFERFGVDYCCGGAASLAVAANQADADLDALIDALGQAIETAPRQGQGDTKWFNESLTDLTNHILETHHVYMRRELPRIRELLDKVSRAHGEKHGAMLSELAGEFNMLRGEIEAHLDKEEQILFPYIIEMDRFVSQGEKPPPMHCGSVGNPIRQMEHEHDSAGAALARMRGLTDNFTCPPDVCESFKALYDAIRELEEDLHMHIHLENNILFPRAIEMEQQSCSQ